MGAAKGTKSDFGPHPAKPDEAQVILWVSVLVAPNLCENERVPFLWREVVSRACIGESHRREASVKLKGEGCPFVGEGLVNVPAWLAAVILPVITRARDGQG